ncbi:MAG: hypothetical protein V4710_24645, partial [Verrucomicrobiota bacterium]
MNNMNANGPLGNSALSVILGDAGTTGTLAYTGATATSSKGFEIPAGATGVFAINPPTTAVTLTITGSLTGSGTLVKGGANNGFIRFDADNSGFSGPIIVNSGSLGSGGNGTTLGTGTITINGGDISGRGAARTITNNIVVGGADVGFGTQGNNTTFTGSLDLGGLSRIIRAGTGTTTAHLVTFAGAVSNGVSITKRSQGILSFEGATALTGDITVEQGAVRVMGAGQLNSGTYAGNISIINPVSLTSNFTYGSS